MQMTPQLMRVGAKGGGLGVVAVEEEEEGEVNIMFNHNIEKTQPVTLGHLIQI
jgi:hypothetical protein